MEASVASLTPKAVETRERILDAAESVFARRGFDAATTREIAAASESTTVYKYFESKEDLYAAVLQRAIEPLIDLMSRFARDRHRPGAADEVIREVLSRLAGHEATTRLVYREIVADGPLADRLTRTLFEPLLRRVRDEVRGGGHVASDMEPFIAALFVHLSFSHVALAPLLSRVFERDMLSADSLARQVRVIGAAVGIASGGLDGE